MAEEKEKKKSSKLGVLFLLLLLILALLAFLLMHGFGFGFGSGGGTGLGGERAGTVSVAEESSQEEVSAEAETTVEEKVYVEVTVKEGGYLYQNGSIELDALKEELLKLEGITVRISDENASKNAYDALLALLDEQKIPYEKAES